jgi:tRNA/tmRNA/rRNA uracil-C5-methylase (TrmA/RlmC/RlmD family)
MDDRSHAQPGDTCRLTITDIAFGGDGVARSEEGAVVFVPFTACGDTVDVRITSAQRTFLRGEVVEVVEAGPGRVSPPCPYFGSCGGCAYQHLEYEKELSAKVSQLGDSLTRLGGLSDFPDPDPVFPSPRVYGYRNKIRLEPVPGSGDEDSEAVELDYGYCMRDNVTFMPIERCPLAAEPLNVLLRKVGRTAWGRKNARRPRPFPVTLRVTEDGSTHFYFGRAPASIPWLHERLLGRDISVPLGSFWQVNNEVADGLARTVSAWYGEEPTRVLIDAYAGVGGFSLAVGDSAQYRVLIEEDSQAMDAARYNHEMWGNLSCRCVAERVERGLPGALRTVNTSESTVILDPPRAGCGRSVIRTLCQLKPARILYVSCNAGTLARDLRALVGEGGFRLERLALFDMFPRTAHFESLALLRS